MRTNENTSTTSSMKDESPEDIKERLKTVADVLNKIGTLIDEKGAA